MAEMVVAAGSRQPAPLAPVRRPPDALPSAGRPDRPSIHYLERGSPMRNRKREICTSGSARDEDGQPPHLLGRRQFLHLAAGAAALSTLVHVAWAQDWPTRPVTMVVPFAAGGPLDTGGRLRGPRFSRTLGQQVLCVDRLEGGRVCPAPPLARRRGAAASRSR